MEAMFKRLLSKRGTRNERVLARYWVIFSTRELHCWLLLPILSTHRSRFIFRLPMRVQVFHLPKLVLLQNFSSKVIIKLLSFYWLQRIMHRQVPLGLHTLGLIWVMRIFSHRFVEQQRFVLLRLPLHLRFLIFRFTQILRQLLPCSNTLLQLRNLLAPFLLQHLLFDVVLTRLHLSIFLILMIHHFDRWLLFCRFNWSLRRREIS